MPPWPRPGEEASGLRVFMVVRTTNCVVPQPVFTLGTKEPVVVGGRKTNFAQPARIVVRLFDLAGNGDRPRSSSAPGSMGPGAAGVGIVF